MRQSYSIQLAIVTGVFILSLTVAFAAIRSQEASSSAEKAAQMPHPFEGYEECTACHGIKGINPYPRGHIGWKNSSCLKCHSHS